MSEERSLGSIGRRLSADVGGDRVLIEIIVVTTAVFMLSAIIHSSSAQPNIYSDIASFWGRREVAEGLIPYVDFVFEYPQLCGLITYVSASIGGTPQAYFTMMSFFLYPFTIGSAVLTYLLAKLNGFNTGRVYRYFLLAPSMIIYLVYNFDIINTFFVLLALYTFQRGKTLLSAASIGLGVLSKLTPVLLIPIFAQKLKSWRRQLAFVLVAVAIPVLVNAPLAAVSFENWWGGYKWHMDWGLENSWLVFLFPDSGSWGTAKLFSQILMLLVVVRVIVWKNDDLIQKSFAMLGGFLLATYVYTPQMNLVLLPLFVLSSESFLLFYPWELANAFIILSWFTVPTPPGPTAAYTTPQWSALVRAFLLLLILVQVTKVRGRTLLSWVTSKW